MAGNPYKIELDLDFGSLGDNQNKLDKIINKLKNTNVNISVNADGLDKIFQQFNKIETTIQKLDMSTLEKQIQQFSNQSNKGFDNAINKIENYSNSIKNIKNELSKLGDVKINSNQVDTLTNDVLKFTATVKQADGVIQGFDYKAKNFVDVGKGHFKVLGDGYELINKKIIDNTDVVVKKNKASQEKMINDTINFVSQYNSKIDRLYKNGVLPENKIKNLETKINLLNGDETKKYLKDIEGEYEKLISEEKQLKEENKDRLNSMKNTFEEQSKMLNYIYQQEEKLKNIQNGYKLKFDTNSGFYGNVQSQYGFLIQDLEKYKKENKELTLEEKQSINSRINDLKRLGSEYIVINNNIKKCENQLNSILEKYKNIAKSSDVNRLRGMINSLSPDSSNIIKDLNNVNNQLNTFQSKLQEQQRVIGLGNKVSSSKLDVNSSLKDIEKFVKQTYGLKSSVTSVNDSMDKMGKKIRQVNIHVNEGGNVIKKYKMNIDEATKSTYSMSNGIESTLTKQATFSDRIKNSIDGLIRFTIAGTALFGTLRKIKEGIGFINELNTIQTNIGMITGMSVDEIQSLTERYGKLANTLHTTNKEIMLGSEEFLRAGRNADETAKLLEGATIGAKISGQNTKDTSEQLIAITNGFKMEAKDTMKVVDTLSTIDNNAATSFMELAEGMKRSSSSAQMAGVTMQQLSSYVGVVSSTTRKSAESIGESFKIGGLVA